MQNPIKSFSIGIPFLLAGFAIGYAFRDLREHAATSVPSITQTNTRAPLRANHARSDDAESGNAETANFGSLIREVRQNRWSDDSESRLWRGIDALSLSEI